ncbi:MAG: flagellar hook assembly protein FlgD [Sulfuritalea sp.]|jgi:flagellar basal-body rod modification protein FlgD|nr:flagellar hook assembly protein FlgD [Azonexus sp.]MCC7310397.1 flagellar hook assembly protein FlgD [Sulfuritalea sp.]
MTTTVTAGGTGVAQTLIDSVNGTASTKAKSVTNEAQDRFLKLLTTQLKNQDPLNPMDNAQMTSQLAQISTVDGIEKLNATLQKLLSSTVDAEAMQAAALVGRQVMVAGSGLKLTGSGAVGGMELAAAADQVVLTIKDPNGLPIRTIELGDLDAGVHTFAWDGKTDSGAEAAHGSYSMALTAKRGTEKVDISPLELAGVVSVNRSSQGVTLDLGPLGLATMGNVKQIF